VYVYVSFQAVIPQFRYMQPNSLLKCPYSILLDTTRKDRSRRVESMEFGPNTTTFQENADRAVRGVYMITEFNGVCSTLRSVSIMPLAPLRLRYFAFLW